MKLFNWLFRGSQKPHKPERVLLVNMDDGHCYSANPGEDIPEDYRNLDDITKNELWYNLSAMLIKAQMRSNGGL